jgi:tripartite-type tricarboxylate transporter receptor subunit TctC
MSSMRALAAVIAIWSGAISAIPASAQDWPTRPLTLVVPWAAGGGTDVMGRIMARRMSEILGQQVIVENVPGAGGMTGAARVARAEPDGYTVLFGGESPNSQSPLVNKAPLYDPATDFTPVALMAIQPLILVARSGIPAANLPDFIAYAKANQSTMQYGSPGTGTGSHLACALLGLSTGIDVTHVPYRGLGPAMQELLAGRIDYLCPTITTAMSQIEAKQVQVTAVLGRERSPRLPSIATAEEQGLKDFEVYSWNAIFLPKATPAPVVEKLHAAAVAAMDQPAVQGRLHDLGANAPPPEQRSAQYLQSFVQSELKKWSGVVKAAGIAAE